MLLRHVMPNAAAPIIVTATVELGVFIVSEATLSFLGIGLPSSVVSWGADIAAAKDALNSHPSVLLFPAGALALTVLGIMIYLAIRFEWKFAVAGIIANLHDVVIILGFFAFFQWEFSLSVLAAVLALSTSFGATGAVALIGSSLVMAW